MKTAREATYQVCEGPLPFIESTGKVKDCKTHLSWRCMKMEESELDERQHKEITYAIYKEKEMCLLEKRHLTER